MHGAAGKDPGDGVSLRAGCPGPHDALSGLMASALLHRKIMDAFEGTVYQAMGESLGWGSWQGGRGVLGPRCLSALRLAGPRVGIRGCGGEQIGSLQWALHPRSDPCPGGRASSCSLRGCWALAVSGLGLEALNVG